MRLIDADALLQDLKLSKKDLQEIREGLKYDDEKRICDSEILTFGECIMRVNNAPTVDIKTEVAKVVRCKDCEHWEATDDGVSWNNKGRTDGVCERLWSIHCAERHLTERDHYCGYGRRKTQKEGVGG